MSETKKHRSKFARTRLDGDYLQELIRTKLKGTPQGSFSLSRFMTQYRPFIFKAAGNYYSMAHSRASLAEFEDLVGVGFYGLFVALNRFDEKRGLKFLTYAGSYVEGYMRREVNKTIPIKKSYGALRFKLSAAADRLRAKGITKPTLEHLSQESGIKVEKIMEVDRCTFFFERSLSENLFKGSGDSDFDLEDSLWTRHDAEHQDPLLVLQKRESTDLYFRRIAKDAHLSESQVQLLRASVYEGKSHEEISEETGLSQATIQVRIGNAYEKIRQNVANIDGGSLLKKIRQIEKMGEFNSEIARGRPQKSLPSRKKGLPLSAGVI